MADFNLIIWLIFLFLLVEVRTVRSQSVNETLVLVHTIFRHGDRNPDTLNLYKNSPYYNEIYYAPYGYGQLTNKGKLTSYEVGRALRQRYNDFLDEAYNINVIEPRSSEFNRTKDSLQVMLAGLFPPTQDLIWLEGLNWQPISFNYVERQYDKELFCYGCPNWDPTIDAYLKSSEGQTFTNKYNETFKYISEHTGENITEIIQVYYMYFGFLIQEELNFTLPEWTKEVYPYPMKTIATEYYALMFSTINLKKMSGGYLLKKIIEDTRKKIDGSIPRRKMFIYSGHENNIASVLKILDVWNEEEIATYGSYVLIELHNINNTYVVQIFYQNYNTTDPVLLQLPACGEVCTFDKFVTIASEFIPEDDSICGKVSTSSSTTIMSSMSSLSLWYILLTLVLNKLYFIYF